ncbi:Ras-GAP domain-containing protein [Meloidogyne graminicola]|uniref:Ras-GAP domain-containing protein n=1 Tax=Meloidogyne graminicola TaxID=189291 RepID=A0A8T0A0A2_9BILA|nr:Ras-GAP domain-containing protein [Meloidogyne graminicola]
MQMLKINFFFLKKNKIFFGEWGSNSIQKMSSLIQQQQNNNNNNYPYKYQQRYNKRNEQFQQHQQQNLISRIENSLSIWILEAKGISPKKKFFCEISLDNIIKARTSTKSMSDGICFWGEHFNFQKLSCHSQQLCIDLIKEPEPYGGNGGKKKKV